MAKDENIDYALRVGYVALLRNNVTLNGSIIPVRAQGQFISDNIYILISSIGNAYNSPKNATVSISSLLISIFCKGTSLAGNEHEDIGAQVLKIIEPYNGFRVPINSNFRVLEQHVVSDNPSPVLKRDTTEPVYERNIIIEHRISHSLR